MRPDTAMKPETSFENWGYTKDVFFCDMEIPLPKMDTPSDLRIFQIELIRERFPKMHVTSRYYSERLKEFGFLNDELP